VHKGTGHSLEKRYEDITGGQTLQCSGIWATQRGGEGVKGDRIKEAGRSDLTFYPNV
jgi:hypothetical protein